MSPVNDSVAETDRLQRDPTRDLPYAFGGPAGTGRIRSEIDDFIVDEQLGFDLSGEGEHVFLRIEKRGENTDWLAQRLARHAGVRMVAVGYAGMKDRYARTTQWFSVQLPGKEAPDWREFESESIRVLACGRHSRKLKKGALVGNRFRITVRELALDHAVLLNRLTSAAGQGVPNYFGPQRFGRNGQNVAKAIALFQGQLRQRKKRGIYLSAARSYLFNLILSERVTSGNWNRALAGDAMMLNGTKRYFKTDALCADNQSRITIGDIHPTGALWGTGDHDVSAAVLALETRIADTQGAVRQGLEAYGAVMSRRSLRLPLRDLRWEFPDEDRLVLTFFLPAGGYATAVLRELIDSDGSVPVAE